MLASNETSTICSLCLECSISENDVDPLDIKCSTCEIRVHLECSRRTSPLSNSKTWNCGNCNQDKICYFCSHKGGSFVITGEGNYLHGYCSQNMPHSHPRMENGIVQVGIIPTRFRSSGLLTHCIVCSSSVGILMKCSSVGCTTYIHGYCGKFENQYYIRNMGGVTTMFCNDHVPKDIVKMKGKWVDLSEIRMMKYSFERGHLICDMIRRRDKMITALWKTEGSLFRDEFDSLLDAYTNRDSSDKRVLCGDNKNDHEYTPSLTKSTGAWWDDSEAAGPLNVNLRLDWIHNISIHQNTYSPCPNGVLEVYGDNRKIIADPMLAIESGNGEDVIIIPEILVQENSQVEDVEEEGDEEESYEEDDDEEDDDEEEEVDDDDDDDDEIWEEVYIQRTFESRGYKYDFELRRDFRNLFEIKGIMYNSRYEKMATTTSYFICRLCKSPNIHDLFIHADDVALVVQNAASTFLRNNGALREPLLSLISDPERQELASRKGFIILGSIAVLATIEDNVELDFTLAHFHFLNDINYDWSIASVCPGQWIPDYPGFDSIQRMEEMISRAKSFARLGFKQVSCTKFFYLERHNLKTMRSIESVSSMQIFFPPVHIKPSDEEVNTRKTLLLNIRNVIALIHNMEEIESLLESLLGDLGDSNLKNIEILHTFIRNRYNLASEFLLSHDKRLVNTVDEYGFSPILVAICAHNFDMALHLMRIGADPFIKNVFGVHALDELLSSEDPDVTDMDVFSQVNGLFQDAHVRYLNWTKRRALLILRASLHADGMSYNSMNTCKRTARISVAHVLTQEDALRHIASYV